MTPRSTLLNPRKSLLTTLATALLAASVASAQNDGEATTEFKTKAQHMWWEAEDVDKTNFPDTHPFAPATTGEARGLSGGQWIGVDGPRDEVLYLDYYIDVEQTDTYHFWVRKFWKHGPFRYSFNGMEWQEVGRDRPLMDNARIRDKVGANWVYLETMRLHSGTHYIRLELTENEGAAAFDAFLLTNRTFRPRAATRPDETPAPVEDGWFPFHAPADPLNDDAIINLREFNHTYAGAMGALKRNKDTLYFEAQPDRPVRFWGITLGYESARLPRQAIDYLAKRLAKMGVNYARLHIDYDEPAPGEKLERIHYLVSALREQGIYTGLGFHCTAATKKKAHWSVDAVEDGDYPHHLLFFVPEMQKDYRDWARQLLTTNNPFTGIPLGKDPAVATIEIVDEDNLFFWTFSPYDEIAPKYMPILERAYGTWLADKYGSIQAALRTWGPSNPPEMGRDDPAAGRVALYDAGRMAGYDWSIEQSNARRVRDQREFLTTFQRDFFAHMQAYFKDDLGFKGLVNATNWKTANPRILDPLDKYTYQAADIMGLNAYFGGKTEGENNTHPYGEGNTFDDISILLNPESLILNQMQYGDFPHFWTEGNWSAPNRFRSEMPLTVASYGSLQGIDGLMTFWAEPDWVNTLPKWPVQTPAILGQFPAAALIYRMQLVTEAPIVLKEALLLEDLYAGKGAAFGQEMALDAYKEKQLPLGVNMMVEKLGSLDPLAFYAGRVIREVGDDPGPNRVSPIMARSINREEKYVTAVTQELFLDYENGVEIINAALAQGAVGFLGQAGRLELASITMEFKPEFGALVAVSLDGKPLDQSNRILVQVMSEEKNRGWLTEPVTIETDDGPRTVQRTVQRIVNGGGAPIIVRQFAGSFALNRQDAARLSVYPLDINGYREARIGDASGFALQPTTFYYLLEDANPPQPATTAAN